RDRGYAHDPPRTPGGRRWDGNCRWRWRQRRKSVDSTNDHRFALPGLWDAISWRGRILLTQPCKAPEIARRRPELRAPRIIRLRSFLPPETGRLRRASRKT